MLQVNNYKTCRSRYYDECLFLGGVVKKAKDPEVTDTTLVAFFSYQEGQWTLKRFSLNPGAHYRDAIQSNDARRIYDAIVAGTASGAGS